VSLRRVDLWYKEAQSAATYAEVAMREFNGLELWTMCLIVAMLTLIIVVVA